MQDIEKLGLFYLGKPYDRERGAVLDEPLLYDSRDLTTHAVCVGMTGSGKTGLCLSLIEEAAIDGVPTIALDPKGDLGNLLLTFPELAPADFQPWVDPAEAARQGLSVEASAARTAETWRNGLAASGQSPERIARLRAAADLAIYTPGSSAGRPLAILRSLAAPAPDLAADATALRDRILCAVSALLGLLGLAADPLQSREHILLSTLLDRAWREGRDVGLPDLIQAVQKPPFDKVGVFDLESFYPARERLGLAMALNNLLASPGFSAWMEGEPLDIQRLLYTPAGRPRVAILSIAHLGDAERMFFVTLLLNEVLAWMRTQPGTGSLRAILYMDEIFGYFPPTAVPPSKPPMLTLLKQARAYGLGIVLATQNPVDLDYKGLANAGTWLIGRLQTERDRTRVLDGLAGALAGDTELDRGKLETLLAGLGNRVFLMRNVHDEQPVLFQSRWTLSYLRGPLTLPQIRQLSRGGTNAGAPPPAHAVPAPIAASVAAPGSCPPSPPPAAATGPVTGGARPPLPAGVPEQFLRPAPGRAAAGVIYHPRLSGSARMHFVDATTRVDEWLDVSALAALNDVGTEPLWDEAARPTALKQQLDSAPLPAARFAELPAACANLKSYAAWQKGFAEHLYQKITLDLQACAALKLVARPGESEGDFRARLALAVREQRDLKVEKLRRTMAPKLLTLQDRLRRAEERVAREQSQVGQQRVQTAISIGATVLGALFGRKLVSASNVGRAATAARSASRVTREQEDVARAADSVESVRSQLAALQAEVEAETARLQAESAPERYACEILRIRPRKADLAVGAIALVWAPWAIGLDTVPRPAYDNVT